jgi:hypothetical protein
VRAGLGAAAAIQNKTAAAAVAGVKAAQREEDAAEKPKRGRVAPNAK